MIRFRAKIQANCKLNGSLLDLNLENHWFATGGHSGLVVTSVVQSDILSGDIGSPPGQLCDLQCGADYQDHLIRHSFPLCGCSKYRIWIKPQETAGENDRNICDHLIGIKSQDNAHWYTLTHIVARNWYRDSPFGMR